MTQHSSRRRFLAASGAALAGTAARAGAQVAGANDRLAIGFIGVGNRGSQLLRSFLKNDTTQVVSLCDVDRGILQKARELVSGPVALEKDFRRQLDRKELDAVVIATPDHWHAVQTIMAFRSVCRQAMSPP